MLYYSFYLFYLLRQSILHLSANDPHNYNRSAIQRTLHTGYPLYINKGETNEEMSSHRFRRSSSELNSGQIICCSRGKWDLNGFTYTYHEHLPGGMGLAPTGKALPAKKRLVAHIRCRGGFDSHCPSPSAFFFFLKSAAILETKEQYCRNRGIATQ